MNGSGGLKAVILVGGPHWGTRFRPLSFEVPQPLFPVAGSPMIQHHLEACKKLPCIKEVLVIGYYQLNKELTQFIQNMQREYKISIRYLQEHCPLGTGGGIYHFRDQIMSGNPSAFFVFHADVCCNFPVAEMYQFQQSSTPDGKGFVILGSEVSELQAVYYGCMVEDSSTHEVKHYVEKPETFVSSMINAGAYLFTSHIFELLGAIFHNNNVVESTQVITNGNSCDAIDLERQVLSSIAGQGKLFAYITEGFWSPIKTAGNAIYANRLYLSSFRDVHPERLLSRSSYVRGDVRVHPTAVVDPTAVLGPNVYVGSGVTIGAGARVKEAIILDRAEIKEHCCVLHSIIGWECTLGPWSRIEGYPSDPNPNDPHGRVPQESLFNKEGRLNPSITILGQGVSVHPELMVLNSIVLPHKDIKQDYHNQIIL